MRVKVAIAGSEYEAPSQLEGIPAELVLSMAVPAGAFAGGGVIAPKKVEQRGAAQSGDAIGVAFLIDEQRECDSGFFSEEAGIVLVAQSDCGDAGAFTLEISLVLAQLRDVLAAEDSAIVPQKGQHRRGFGPNRSQPDLIPLRIGQTQSRQSCAQ